MKRTKLDRSQIILKGSANRISDKGLAFVTNGTFKLTQDTLIWQSVVGSIGQKEVTIPVAEITDVMVKKPLLLRIVLRNGDVYSFIIPIGAGKGKHKEDWQRILLEMAPSAQGSVLPEDDDSANEKADQPSAVMRTGQNFCMQCGSALREGARFCSQCGKEVTG